MAKKVVNIVKVVMVVLMLLGAVVTMSNVWDTELNSEPGKWRRYIPWPVDCTGTGTTCYDMTGTSPK